MPVLSISANALSDFHQYICICKSSNLPLYEQSFESLLFSPLVSLENQFSSLSSMELKEISVPMVNKIYSEFLKLNFDNFIVVYTDGSVSPLSAGYSFFIPELNISFSNNLPPSSSSFTARVLYNHRSFISYLKLCL